jgi:hypothetical protein
VPNIGGNSAQRVTVMLLFLTVYPVKSWTIRQGDIWGVGDTFLDDVAWDVDNPVPKGEQIKILAKVKQVLRSAGTRVT